MDIINTSLAQQIVNAVKDVCGYDINYIDKTGKIFASTDESRIGDFHEIGFKAAKTGETIEVMHDNSFEGTKRGVNIPVFHSGNFLAVIGISGDPEEVRKYAYLAIRITKLIIREQELEASNRSYKERISYIIKSIIYDTETDREYLNLCLNELRVDTEEAFAVIIVQLKNRYNVINVSLIEKNIGNMFTNIDVNLFTYEYPLKYIGFLRGPMYNKALIQLKNFAQEYSNILCISIGSMMPFYQLRRSYDDAAIAMSSIIKSDKENFANFDDLDIEIIIGSADDNSKEKYIGKTIAALEEKDIEILRIYYEEDMSLSNTCERLYMHKNTLQYRLDRIFRITGYNPRKFRDAAILYMAIKIK